MSDGLTPEQRAAAAQAIRNQLDSSPDWAHLAEAVRYGAEHIEKLSDENGGMTGQEKRDAAVAAIREVWSARLKELLRSWDGPLYIGKWAYPLLVLFVYPIIYRVGMWAYDKNAARFIDILIDASKGKLNLNLGD